MPRNSPRIATSSPAQHRALCTGLLSPPPWCERSFPSGCGDAAVGRPGVQLSRRGRGDLNRARVSSVTLLGDDCSRKSRERLATSRRQILIGVLTPDRGPTLVIRQTAMGFSSIAQLPPAHRLPHCFMPGHRSHFETGLRIFRRGPSRRKQALYNDLHLLSGTDPSIGIRLATTSCVT